MNQLPQHGVSALVIQHAAPEGPHSIARALTVADVPCTVYRADQDSVPLPRARDLAGLVVMGGPASAYSDQGFPTREAELGLIAECLQLQIPILGVCLGAQLLAAAAGARVFPGTHGREIGWGPLHLEDDAERDPLFAGLPRDLTVLHWHGDTYDLPPGAVHLASSPKYSQQAFRVGARAWGLQFHIEMDVPAVEAIARAFPDEAADAPGGLEGLLQESRRAVAALAPARDSILGRFARMCAAPSAWTPVESAHSGPI